jgi:DNA-binding response OmpR family regulator
VKKLIIIEDDKDVRDMVVFTFENNGFEVIQSGKDIPVEDVAALTPHIVVIGYQVKGIPGNDICKKLKASPLTDFIPVILYSPNVDTNKIAIGSSADGHLGKPLELEDLVYLVHRISLNNR